MATQSVSDLRPGRIVAEPAVVSPPVRQSNLWTDAWRRYLRNRPAVVAGSIFLLVVLYCICAPIVAPEHLDEVDFADCRPGRRPGTTHLGRTSSGGISSCARRSGAAARS